MIPEEELTSQRYLNLAPMVDFLFLVLAVLAVLAVTRTSFYDSEVHVVKMQQKDQPASVSNSETNFASTIMLSIDAQGHYKWITESHEFVLDGAKAILQEIKRQQELGLLPKENSQMRVLLQIDQRATWQSIASLIFAIKQAGLHVSPVYQTS